MSWTQAICEDCWAKREPGREPIRLTTPEVETCAYCGEPSTAGIYTRDNPKSVPFPTQAA